MGQLARIFTGMGRALLGRIKGKESVMIEQGQCERCAALEREVAALKTE